MYFTCSLSTMVTMMIVLCCTVVRGFTTNLPPRSTFVGHRTLTNAPVTTTSLCMNIETVQTKENIRVGVIGTSLGFIL